jgi:glycosyltransferase involved in cell wall biosynthesis
MATVSIVVPNYNHSAFLQRRLDSVFGQTFTDLEVIILDDCSDDESRCIIEQYRSNSKTKCILYNDSNSNSTFKQWEKGIQQCSSEYIWIAESDDFAHKNFLSTLMKEMLSSDSIGLVYCQSMGVDVQDRLIGSWKSYTDDLDSLLFANNFQMNGKIFLEKYLIHKNCIPNASAVLFRKKYYSLAGGVETFVKNCGDWIMWMKIIMNCHISFVSESLNYFRKHENSVIAKANRQYNYARYLERHDRSMRVKFQDYLEENYIEQIKLLKLNYQYIDMKNMDEETFLQVNKESARKEF